MSLKVLICFTFLIISYDCQPFCDNKTIDSALTILDTVYMFRDQYYWNYTPKYLLFSGNPGLNNITFLTRIQIYII